jgi:hypothetical protein
MPTPSVVQSATTYNYVSSLDIVQGLHKPEVDKEFYRRYGDQNLQGFAELTGKMNPVSAIEYHHYEDDWLHEVVRATGAGGGAGAAVTCTATQGFTIANDNSPYIAAGSTTAYIPRNQDLILTPGGILAIVSGVSGSSFDLTPVVTGESIPALVGTEELVVIGNAHQEQTGQPLSRNGRTNLYTNNLMIKKSTNTVSGSELGVQTWIEVPDKNGRMGYLWYFESGYQEYRRFMNECETTMLLGQKVTNATLATNQPTLTVTEGLIPFIENYGNTVNYSGVSGFTLADLDTMVKTLDRNRGSKENTIWAGINLSLAMDDTFLDLFQDGAVSYGTFGFNKDLAVNMQFSSFKRGNYVFHKKTYDAFNYPKMLGAAGQRYPDFAMVIPSDNVVDAKTKKSVPSFRINYLQGKGNGYSREMEEWLTGGANGVYNTTTDEVNVNFRAHRGFEGFAPNRYCVIAKS